MKFATLETKKLTVNKRYQRELDERRVDKIATEFDPRLLGTLEVSRHNGKCVVFDGQHRLAALKQIHEDQVPCLVHEGLSAQEEADLFVALQRERRNITPLDRFRARLFSGDRDARALDRIVEKCGYHIASHKGDTSSGVIRAITTLERVYRRDGELGVAAAFGLVDLWKGDEKALSGSVLEGSSILMRQYGDRVTDEARARLAEVSPVAILRRAAVNGGGTMLSHAVSRELRKVAGVRGRPLKGR